MLSEAEMAKLVHEFQVHQIELEMQNEALLQTNIMSKTAADKYTELFDFAPTGYFILSAEGIIKELNHVGAHVLGKGRSNVSECLFVAFISEKTRPTFNIFFEKICGGHTKESCDVKISVHGGDAKILHLTGINHDNEKECFITAVDITEQKHTEEALRESEKKFSLFMDYLPAIVFIKDNEGRTVYTNKYMNDTVGSSQWLGKTMLEVFPNEFGKKLYDDDMHSLKTGHEKIEESVPAVNDGTVHTYETQKFLIDRPGKEPYLGGISLDITKRKHTEEVIRESELRFREVIENSIDAPYKRNIKTNEYEYFSPVFAGITGYTPDEMKQLPLAIVLDLMHPDDVDAVKRVIAESMASPPGSIHYLEYRFKHKDGRYRWIQDKYIVACDRQGNPESLIGSVSDITESKLKTDSLKESEQNYRTLADSGHTLVWISGTDKQCVYFNKVWLGFTGRTLEQELGNGWAEGVHPDDMQHCLDIYNESFGRRENFSMEYRLRRHDGEYRWIVDDGTARYNSNGEFVGYIGHCYDITERRMVMEALRESEERLTLALDQSHLAYWEMDAATRTFTFNDRFYELYHTTAEREGGYHMAPDVYVREFLLQAEQSIVHDAVSRLLSGEISHIQHEHLIRRRDGEIRNILVRINVVYDSAGRIVGTRGTNQDITELKKVEKALTLSESKLQAILDNSYDGIGVHINGIWQMCNPAALRLFGYASPEELIGTPILNVIVPGEHERITEYVRKRSAGMDAPTAYITRGVRKDGTEFDMEVMLSKFKLENKWNALVMLRDITERRQAEENLRLSKLRYQTLFEKASDGIMYMTTEGKIIGVNESYAKMHGYSVNEVVDKNIHDLDTPETSQIIKERMSKIVSGEKLQFEAEHFHKDGNIIQQEISASYITIGEEKYIQSFHRDITERKHAENAIKQISTQLTRVMESTKDVIAIMDTDYRYTLFNSAFHEEFKKIFGQDLKVGDSMVQALSYLPDDLTYAKKFWDRAFGGEDFIVTHEFGNAKLERNWYELHFSPIRDNQDNVVGAVHIVRNVSERMLMEEKQRQMQKLESIGTLAGGIAHDFNNLLNAMMGNVSLAQQRLPADHPAAKNLQRTMTAMERAATLTKQMLAFSGKGRFQIIAINLVKVVQEHIDLFEASFVKNVICVPNLSSTPVTIKGDPGQIEQIVMNLIINAGEAIGDKQGIINISVLSATLTEEELLPYGRLNNTTLPGGEYALLQVSDNGIGMNEETIAKMFDPFFTTKFVGRGLGLSAVLGIIRGHNGGILVNSKEGAGTVFQVILPLHLSEKDSLPLQHQNAEGAVHQPITLLIDDEQFIVELTEDIFKNASYTLLSTTDPVEGVKMYRNQWQTIDLVILDYSMPKMNGREVLIELRKINPNVKVLMSSGFSEEELVHLMGDHKPSAILRKPHSPRTLLAVVDTLLGKG